MNETGLSEFVVALLINHLAQGLAIVGLVAALLWRLRVNAATRHIVWNMTLAIVCLLPLIAFLPSSGARPTAVPTPVAAIQDTSPETPIVIPREATGISVSPNRESGVIKPPVWLGLIILMTWLAGVVIGIAVVARQLLGTHWLSKQSRPCGAELDSLLTVLSEELAIRSQVRIRIHDQIESPMTVGLLRPWIALPMTWAEGVNKGVLRHALLHELAHIRRRDTWALMFQKTLQILFYFHPAVWLVARQLEVERESACDDWAVARSQSAGEYASSLVSVAESVNLRNQAVLAVGCLRSRSQLRKRITHMLNRNSDHTTRPRRWSIALSLLTMGVMAAAAAQSWPHADGILADVGAGLKSNLQLAANYRRDKITPEDGLLYAAWKGDRARVEQMIAQGADADEIHHDRTSPRTALNAAAGAGHLEIVQLLVEHGANVTRVVRGDPPALTAAASNGHHEVAEFLLDHGADADRRTRGDGSPLIGAAASGNLELVEMLLAAGADADGAVGGDGSPLIAAASRGDVAVVNALLAAGADPERYVPGDEAPLYHAVVRGHVDVVQTLLEAGASADVSYQGDGTPLMLAIRRGDAEIANLLMANGARVNTKVQGDGTALIEAARRGDLENAEMLIRAGADVNQAVSGDGNALINATMAGKLDMAELLISNGAKVNVHVRGDDTPLINAVRSGDRQLVDFLLQAGADVNLAGDYDRELRETRTPLNQANKHGSAAIAARLQSAGAL